jgi:hypothetical protein
LRRYDRTRVSIYETVILHIHCEALHFRHFLSVTDARVEFGLRQLSARDVDLQAFSVTSAAVWQGIPFFSQVLVGCPSFTTFVQ